MIPLEPHSLERWLLSSLDPADNRMVVPRYPAQNNTIGGVLTLSRGCHIDRANCRNRERETEAALHGKPAARRRLQMLDWL
jgi:hypothetical protein